jgi:choline dehydrogenase
MPRAERTIVVGAGSAGAVVAARVTERSDAEVWLLEAGPDYAEPSALPDDLRDGTRNSMTRHDWGFRCVPTPGQIRFAFPRGKVVGGSSAVNTCIALRGFAYDYDEWAARGLPEWSFAACLPAFKRLERDLDVANEWHGADGPIPIRRHKPEELGPWQAAFVEACRELGLPACDDHNAPDAKGVGPHPMNKVNGERMSAARCYLDANVRRRDNLRILAGCHVRRVLFEGDRAIGVEVERRGALEVLRAGRVVLAAGAIQTPGILLRSGLGPRAELERLGVPEVADLPAVGARLLDHPGAAIILAPRRGACDVRAPLLQVMARFTSRRSPYASDVQLQPGSFLPFPLVTLPAVTLMCCLGKPKGTGTLRFPSADPHSRPHIESRVFVHPEDRARAVEALELAWLCARTPAMRKLAHFVWPGEAVLRDRQALSEWLVKSAGSGYHPCGTVPMGADGDPEAALDGRGRVRHVRGLFVVDASVMPTIPSANTNLPTLMLGERFGAWLRDDADV